jgi:hypothetical protein
MKVDSIKRAELESVTVTLTPNEVYVLMYINHMIGGPHSGSKPVLYIHYTNDNMYNPSGLLMTEVRDEVRRIGRALCDATQLRD